MPIVNQIVQPIVSPIVEAILGTEVINGASFDGTNDYLTRGADLTGNADGKTGILALRIRINAGDGVLGYVTFANGGFFLVSKNAANEIEVSGFNTAAAQILRVRSSGNTLEVVDGYVNIICSWDLAATTVQLYLNDVSDANTIIATNDTIDYTRTAWGIMARNTGANKVTGDLTFYYLNTAEYLDISVEANRRKFFDASGNPVLDVAGDGSSATGTAPILYLAGTYDQWENNKGMGGGMTVTGALTEPVD